MSTTRTTSTTLSGHKFCEGTGKFCIVPTKMVHGSKCQLCGRTRCYTPCVPEIKDWQQTFENVLTELWIVTRTVCRNECVIEKKAGLARITRKNLDKWLAKYGAKPSAIPEIYGDYFGRWGLNLEVPRE